MKRRTKTPSKNIRIIRRYQLAQSMLEQGCTVQQLMASLAISDRQTRRLLDDFRAEGCRIASDFVLGSQDEAVFRLVGKVRVL